MLCLRNVTYLLDVTPSNPLPHPLSPLHIPLKFKDLVAKQHLMKHMHCVQYTLHMYTNQLHMLLRIFSLKLGISLYRVLASASRLLSRDLNPCKRKEEEERGRRWFSL